MYACAPSWWVTDEDCYNGIRVLRSKFSLWFLYDSGGSRGAAPGGEGGTLFLGQTEARRGDKKTFLETGPLPFSKGLYDRPRLDPALYYTGTIQ